MDYILEKGDETFKVLGINRALFMDELPCNVFIENRSIEIEKLGYYYRLLRMNNISEEHVTTCNTGNGIIFMTCGFTISLIWSKKIVFLFDSHSQDKNGAFTPSGSSVLLAFKSLSGVQDYIKNEYSKHFPNFHERQFELQYVKIKTNPNSSHSHKKKIVCCDFLLFSKMNLKFHPAARWMCTEFKKHGCNKGFLHWR